MKNDFREYYDEDYIMHGEWNNRFTRFVDKVKTKSGNWRYIYPEDIRKEKLKKVKRDVSYALRNIGSKVTGKNKTFVNNTTLKTIDNGRRLKGNINDYNYEKIQRATRAAYQDKANRNMYSRQNAMAGDSRYTAPVNKKVKRDNSIKISVNSKAAQDFHNQFGKVKNFADSVNAVLKKKKKKKTLKDLFK